MLPGLFPFILALIPHPDPLTFDQISFIIQICVVFTVGFLLLHRVVRRPGERNLLSTTLSYPLTIVAMLLLFPAHAEFTTAVVAVLAFGDGAAYFGGKLFGKTRLPWNADKTWVGTASFVCFAAPIATLAYWVEARNPEPPLLLAALCGTSAAFAGAIGESLPTEITDNLRVGIFASLGVIAAHYAFAGWLL